MLLSASENFHCLLIRSLSKYIKIYRFCTWNHIIITVWVHAGVIDRLLFSRPVSKWPSIGHCSVFTIRKFPNLWRALLVPHPVIVPKITPPGMIFDCTSRRRNYAGRSRFARYSSSAINTTRLVQRSATGPRPSGNVNGTQTRACCLYSDRKIRPYR